jgi:ferredoxin
MTGRDPAVAVREAWPVTPPEHHAILANTDPGEYDLRPLRTAAGKNPIPAVSHIWAASLYLRRERFCPPPVVDGVPFELELARSRRVLSIPANRSALDVMLDRDPTIPYSCPQGFCGTCKVKVLAGPVDHRGGAVVGDDEMLVCVSRANGARLVIDA